MGLWWLSFAADRGFRGAVLVEAVGPDEALRETIQRGINPGGEVLMDDLTGYEELFPESYRNRILSKAEIKCHPEWKTSFTEARAPDDYEPDACICEDCNAEKKRGMLS